MSVANGAGTGKRANVVFTSFRDIETIVGVRCAFVDVYTNRRVAVLEAGRAGTGEGANIVFASFRDL